MHQSAMFYGRLFFETYSSSLPDSNVTIVEIGSQNVNGSLREVCPKNVKYIGLDFTEGEGVDIVIADPYKLPMPDATADVVLSSSCFEHSEFFWLVFLEAMRILKPGGVFYLNAPSNGFFHRWPVDCWRFYPDAGHALINWAKRNDVDAILLESFTGRRSEGRVSEGGMWNDFVAVFLKDQKYLDKFPSRIIHSQTDFYNGYSSEIGNIINHNERGPDFSLIEVMMVDREKSQEIVNSQANELTSLHDNFQALLSDRAKAQEIMESQTNELTSLHDNFQALLSDRAKAQEIMESQTWEISELNKKAAKLLVLMARQKPWIVRLAIYISHIRFFR